MSDRPHTPFLDRVHLPADIRTFQKAELPQLADELRQEMISAVSTSGGHLGSGLGVVELTVAIHHVFNTPEDILIWDVGHQCYPHKSSPTRRDRIRTLRQAGAHRFTKRSESEYDPSGGAFVDLHLAALRLRHFEQLADRPGRAIAVIVDGAMSAGMAYEAITMPTRRQSADLHPQRQTCLSRPRRRALALRGAAV